MYCGLILFMQVGLLLKVKEFELLISLSKVWLLSLHWFYISKVFHFHLCSLQIAKIFPFVSDDCSASSLITKVTNATVNCIVIVVVFVSIIISVLSVSFVIMSTFL